MMCSGVGTESEFIFCDACGGACHLFCVGLEAMPDHDWYCFECQERPDIRTRPANRRSARRRRALSRRHTADTRSLEWARIWSVVSRGAALDLDFPFDDVPSAQDQARRTENRREFREWQRRFEIAERHGNNRFRQAATALVHPQEQPAPESQEELRAWNAFEKAREIQESSTPTPNRRKRKSATASPREPQPEPERKLKRPRARRTLDAGEASAVADGVAESSSKGRSPGSSTAHRRPPASRDAVTGGQGFLRSLLKEVESHPTPNHISDSEQQDSTALPEGASSPRYSSRGASPSSDYASPSATTPRPSSPPPLTSTVSPIFPPAQEFSPFSPAEEDSAERARPRRRPKPQSSPLRSSDHSPTRANMSYATKLEIQKMVKVALRPHYEKQAISKDDYTEINRDVSRKMYDKIGDAEGLANEKRREDWQQVAAEEVDKAIKALPRSAPTGGASSWKAIVQIADSSSSNPTSDSEKGQGKT